MKERPPHEPCKWCQGPVVRREHETSSSYAIRKYCSYNCGDIAKSAAGREFGRVRPADEVQSGLSGRCFADYDITPGPSLGRVYRPATILPGQQD